MILGSIAALLIGEVVLRLSGLRAPEPGRSSRISNGAMVRFPERAGHTVIDLYSSNPRGAFPIDLNDEVTRERLIREKFDRVDEARKTSPFGVVFNFNSRGFREREFAPRAQGTKRIIFIGDSFTEAQGVVENASAVRLVEAQLRRRELRFETWNLGVRGRDFPELEGLVDTAFDLSPDAIVLAMVLNDADRTPELARRWPRVYDSIVARPLTPSWLETHSHFFGLVSSRYRMWKLSRETTAWYRALYREENRAGWTRTQASLQRMGKRCRTRGIAFGVALWPLLVGLEPNSIYPFEAAHAEIRKEVERLGIPFVDLLPSLRGRDSASLWVHSSDLHPNERAQTLAAPVLADFAQVRLLEAADRESVAK